MFDVDFENKGPQLICHPSYGHLREEILKHLEEIDLSNHFILFSSGTTGGNIKGYALSKKALLLNASAVNEHFQLSSGDVWGLSLPLYHVGGLSVLARAYLLKNKIIDARSWNPDEWSEKMKDVSVTTIVPTQLYDLVKKGICPNKNLKYLIVGGDFLSSKLQKEAQKLGWPVIRTLGMSEVCSQLASTETPLSDDLKILPIHEVKSEDGQLLIKSQALFTLEFELGKDFKVRLAEELCDKEGYYKTRDLVRLSGNIIHHLGRLEDEYKIAGHLINLNKLKETLSEYLLGVNLFNKMEFSIEEDERKGKKLVLLALPEAMNNSVVEEISSRINPIKIDEVRVIPSFNRTFLGKLKKNQDPI